MVCAGLSRIGVPLVPGEHVGSVDEVLVWLRIWTDAWPATMVSGDRFSRLMWLSSSDR